ncbi:PorP/SprF family type IX secretion system membrane protein [Sporocytophaga myxococcoides]|uniref:PorP/SprF family type IX secretion system membrane protein n=1 Tax=Sporocytophaga myxococcoides TaxID=153721 RepID=UPI0004150750|nr:type IX secretion system membrane protein PorP/SprF [Sporocytophaga myxococcoides]
MFKSFYFFLTLGSLIITNSAFAQDPQFSQYYNAPLYLNPAFAGTAENTRAILNYRNQWPGTGASFITYAASLDHNIESYRSGVGLLVKRDKQGSNGALVSTDINLFYSYEVWLSNRWTFRPGIQLGYTNRTIDYASFVFGDQLDNSGLTGGATADAFTGSRLNFLDASAGGLFYDDHFWLGIAGFHLNRPNQSVNGLPDAKLPIKFSLHSGYKFFLKSWNGTRNMPERSFTPTFNYKSQGAFDQLDLGAYLTYDPVMFGLWYRGIPVKNYASGLLNNESFILMAGIHFNGISFAYSFDLPISKLSLGNSYGAHEISLIYEWEIPYDKRKIKKRGRTIPCPKFSKRYQNY